MGLITREQESCTQELRRLVGKGGYAGAMLTLRDGRPFAQEVRRDVDSGKFAAVVCLGAVIQGETSHHEYINQPMSAAIMDASLSGGIPVTFGVLTCQSMEQALEFCREDECVEVTPEAIRIRKVELDQTLRARAAARARNS